MLASAVEHRAQRRNVQDMENCAVVYPPMPLQLSPEDERFIEMLADRFVAETLHASEDFAAQGHVVDPSCWKPIKEKDNFVAYQDISNPRSSNRERVWSEDTVVVTASPQNPTFYPTSDRSLQDVLLREGFHNIDDYDSEDKRSLHHDDFTKFGAKAGSEVSVLEKFQPANVPTVFSSGVFPGTVEDMALAFLADTDERNRIRFNTNKEVVVDDTRILAQIHPSDEGRPLPISRDQVVYEYAKSYGGACCEAPRLLDYRVNWHGSGIERRELYLYA